MPLSSTCADECECACVAQVADEHGLETQLNLPQAGVAMPTQQHAVAANPDSDLTQRLAQLRGK